MNKQSVGGAVKREEDSQSKFGFEQELIMNFY